MNSALHLVIIVLATLALLGVAYTFVAAAVVMRFSRQTAPGSGALASVTVLKPLKGAEQGLEDCLASAYAQDYRAPVQIVFGAADPDDAAVAIVRKLVTNRSDRDSAIVIDGTLHGKNHKISNLMNMSAAAKHHIVVMSDSDIRVPPSWLSTIMEELQQPSVGAVTCLYSGRAITGIWSKLTALGISCQFLPNAMLGSALGMAHPCTGATIALRRGTLDAIGGFSRFADELADDYEIGRAVRASGYEVAVSAVIVEHNCTERSFGEWWQHELRWARTIRMIDPAGYAGSIFTQPIPVALLLMFLLGPGIPAIAILGLAVVSRLFLKLAIDRRVDKGVGPSWLLPLRDILWFGVFVVSFFGRLVRWRETQLEAKQRAALQS